MQNSRQIYPLKWQCIVFTREDQFASGGGERDSACENSWRVSGGSLLKSEKITQHQGSPSVALETVLQEACLANWGHGVRKTWAFMPRSCHVGVL